MDAFGRRAVMLSGLSTLLDQAHRQRRVKAAGQVSLFSPEEEATSDPPPVETAELPKQQLLAFEKELLGFYLTAHPLEPVIARIQEAGSIPISEITTGRIGERVTVAGSVTKIKRINTKMGNNEMAFVRIEDLTGSIEIVVFPKIYAQTADVWARDAIVTVTGRIDEKEERLTILADGAVLLTA